MTTVFISGADGFIGSNLAEECVVAGWRVRAMAQYNSMGSAGWLDGSALRDHMEIIQGDVRDSDWCRSALTGVDYVLHLAALIAIPYSYRAPRSYVETNVIGTLNMCQAALEVGVSQFIQMSTSEVYGSARFVPISEAHPVSPQSPYAASKVGADAVARSFHSSFALPLCIARPFNTYGPRQSRRAFIPSVLAQVISGVEAIRVGNTSTTRDLTFVSDTSRVLRSLAESGPRDGSVINVGSGTEHSVEEVIAMIQEIAGTSLPLVQEEARLRPPESEVDRLVCDNTLMRELVGFSPEVSLPVGIRVTLEWMRESGAANAEWNAYAI